MGEQGNMRYVQEIEDLNSIRTLAIADLKKYGIKPPKTKKSKNRDENTDSTNQSVFSNQLDYVPSLIIDGCGPVPRFLVEATEFLENQIHTEGLFRKSGSVSRQKELKDKVELGERLQDAHPYDVASLIKQFFRELPDALLTSRLHDTFLKCHQLEKEEDRRMAVFLTCLMLPWHHLSTLRFFSQFLARVAMHADQNKMDVSNLALCLAPNLLHMNLKAEKMRDSESKLLQVQTSIVRLLIEHADDIGMMNNTLFDQAVLMGSLCCFPSDDELEKSCEELDDSQPVKGKKKKKKKRSGSFQGLVSNLSSSFSKWRKDNKGHNSSSVSDKSSMISIMSSDIPDASCMSEMSAECHVTLPSDYQTPKVMRKRKASAEMLPFSATKKKAILQHMPQMSTLGTPYTPATRTRCATEFAMGSPSIKFVDGASQLVFTATPGEGPPGATPRRKIDRILSPSSAMKVKRHTTAKGGCFSPKTPKSGKRRSVKGFFRRLSGSKESPGGLDSSDMIGKRLANTSSCSVTSKKKGGFFRRHKKTPSSPARLVTHLLPRSASLNTSKDDSISMASTASLSSQGSQGSQESITSLELMGKLGGDVQMREFPNHQRRYSAEGGSPMTAALRRGRPNTVTVGLREPVQRRSLEPGNTPAGPVRHSSQREIAMSPSSPPDCLNCSPVAFDTSPIPHKGDLQMLDCSPIGMAPTGEEMEKVDMDTSSLLEANDTHQMSVMLQEDAAPAPNDVNMTHLESDHERAFIEESVCGEPSEEPKHTPTETKNDLECDVFKKPPPYVKPKEVPSTLCESQVMDTSANSDASDTSVITVIYNGQPVRSSRPLPTHLQGESAKDQKPISEETGTGATTSTPEPMSTCVESEPKERETREKEEAGNSQDEQAPNTRESVVNLQKEQVGRVASTVSQFSAPADADCSDVTTRHATALRFPNSVTRTRGTSPVRIPTIFAKADKEAAMYREITRNVMRGSTKTGVKGKANLPISTNLLRSTSVENARRQLNSSSNNFTSPETSVPEGSDAKSLESMAGHTPVRHPSNSEFRAVEINDSLLNTIEDVCTPKSEKVAKELRTPLTDSTNIDAGSEVLPRIKQPMLVTDVGNRLITKSMQYRINNAGSSGSATPVRRGRPPIKSVKRLQGSPHSPLSPAKSPKRYRAPKQPSPMAGHIRDWDI